MNDFSVEKFHDACDGISHTVTLVKTQFGKIIGGYTPLTWQPSQDDQWCCDENCESFLFSISLNEKYPLKEDEKDFAICNYMEDGPRFGYGKDLRIGDCANSNDESYFDFPTSYNEVNEKYKNGQQVSF